MALRGATDTIPTSLLLILAADLRPISSADGEIATRTPRNFVRGNVNTDDIIDHGDAVALFSFLFRVGDPTRCADAADTNDDGRLDSSDPIYLLQWMYDICSGPSGDLDRFYRAVPAIPPPPTPF